MEHETIRLIDELEKAGMPPAAFQALHHRGSRMKSMRRYSAEHEFQEQGPNRRLHERMEAAVRILRAKKPEDEKDWYRLVAATLSRVPLDAA
jgi:hypothetical protein